MKTSIYRKIFIANLVFIILGGLFLIWYYGIDGHLIREPITFTRDTNISNLQLEKETYNVKETPNFFLSYCKNRKSELTIEWTLIDGQRVMFSEKEAGNTPEGCYPARDKITEPIERIPVFILDTCDAYFIGTLTAKLQGGREIEYVMKTERFCIHSNVLQKVEDIINK